ncbi:hypothetical protein [Mucilaginibacter sp. MD40]
MAINRLYSTDQRKQELLIYSLLERYYLMTTKMFKS